MALDAMNIIAADKRPSFIEHSYFLITLSKFTLITYDLNHMLSDPFSHLPADARRTLDMRKGDVLCYRSNDYSVPVAYAHHDVHVRGFVHEFRFIVSKSTTSGAELKNVHLSFPFLLTFYWFCVLDKLIVVCWFT
jgi:hypothetical protein